MLSFPTFRNLTDSFEAWAYRTGLSRELARLAQRRLLESPPASPTARPPVRRALRFTEAGRLHALGGRNSKAQWRRSWDRVWRLVLFDLPVAHALTRERLRTSLGRKAWPPAGG